MFCPLGVKPKPVKTPIPRPTIGDLVTAVAVIPAATPPAKGGEASTIPNCAPFPNASKPISGR